MCECLDNIISLVKICTKIIKWKNKSKSSYSSVSDLFLIDHVISVKASDWSSLICAAALNISDVSPRRIFCLLILSTPGFMIFYCAVTFSWFAIFYKIYLNHDFHSQASAHRARKPRKLLLWQLLISINTASEPKATVSETLLSI